MPNPLDDISGSIQAKLNGQLPNITAAVNQAMHPERLEAQVLQGLNGLDKKIEAAIEAKITACIAQRLGLANIDAAIGNRVGSAIDSIMSANFSC